MRVGASPLEVYINGKSVVRASDALWSKSGDVLYRKEAPSSRSSEPFESSCKIGQSDVVIRGIVKSFVGSDGLRGDEVNGSNLTAVIRSGRVACIGGAICEASAQLAAADGVPFMDIKDGFVVPVCYALLDSREIYLAKQDTLRVSPLSHGNTVWSRCGRSHRPPTELLQVTNTPSRLRADLASSSTVSMSSEHGAVASLAL